MMHYTYMLISCICQLCIPIPILWSSCPLYAIVWSSVGPCVMLYCKCFSLTVGEDVYDFWLPLVSRILDIHFTVWISCYFLSLVHSDIMCIYFFVSLFYVLQLASLQLSIEICQTFGSPIKTPSMPLKTVNNDEFESIQDDVVGPLGTVSGNGGVTNGSVLSFSSVSSPFDQEPSSVLEEIYQEAVSSKDYAHARRDALDVIEQYGLHQQQHQTTMSRAP